MRFAAPLTRGILLRRYKRFLADIRLEDGQEITAHLANSGSMTGTSTPGMDVWLSHHDNPKRKLAWSWELVRVDGHLVGVNTAHPNAIVAEAIQNGEIPELGGYDTLRREVPYGEKSRVDMVLSAPDRPDCYVEVKNVHLKQDEWAEFPDAVTARGTKHLQELQAMIRAGYRSVMVFLVQRADCTAFRPAAQIDPLYARTLYDAVQNGVETLCYHCTMGLDEIRVAAPLPIHLISP